MHLSWSLQIDPDTSFTNQRAQSDSTIFTTEVTLRVCDLMIEHSQVLFIQNQRISIMTPKASKQTGQENIVSSEVVVVLGANHVAESSKETRIELDELQGFPDNFFTQFKLSSIPIVYETAENQLRLVKC